jgi:hypothetical protein
MATLIITEKTCQAKDLAEGDEGHWHSGGTRRDHHGAEEARPPRGRRQMGGACFPYSLDSECKHGQFEIASSRAGRFLRKFFRSAP